MKGKTLLILLLLAGCGGAGGSDGGEDPAARAPAAAPLPECTTVPYPAPSNLEFPDKRTHGGVVVPATFQFFGPVQAEGALTASVGQTWSHPGSALTPSTKILRFDLPHPTVASARWTVAWVPRSPGAAVRLVAMDIASPSPVNPITLATICSSDRDQPTAVSVDVTDALATVAAEGRTRILVQQFWDDGVAWTLYESRLEINFEL